VSRADLDPATAPMGALLTVREMARVMRVFNLENEPDPTRTKAVYIAELRAIAARLYPGKVALPAEPSNGTHKHTGFEAGAL
jgi:hypothetical protein